MLNFVVMNEAGFMAVNCWDLFGRFYQVHIANEGHGKSSGCGFLS